MCEHNAYLKKNGTEEMVMETVGRLTFEGDAIVLETMLGDVRKIEGELLEIDFLQNRIVIAPRR